MNMKKLHQEAFHLNKEKIDIIHGYKYLEIDFYSQGYLEPFSIRQGIANMKALMGTSRREAVAEVQCWNLNPIYSRLWCFHFYAWH